MAKIILFAFGLFSFALLAGCSKPASTPQESAPNQATSSEDGTQDGGGGHLEGAQDDAILAAILDARDLLSEERSYLAIFLGTDKQMTEEEKQQVITVAKVVASPAVRDASLPASLKDYIGLSPLKYVADGPCPAPDKDNADASVAKFEIGAEICFSISNLRRVPKETLLQHVTALWMHELAHVNGFDERSAKLVERVTSLNFRGAVYSSARAMPARVMKLFGMAVFSTNGAVHVLSGDTSALEMPTIRNPHVLIGQSMGHLASIKDVLTELGSTRKVFLSEKADPVRERILVDLTDILSDLERLSGLSLEELQSASSVQELRLLTERIRQNLNRMEGIRKEYEEQAVIIGPQIASIPSKVKISL